MDFLTGYVFSQYRRCEWVFSVLEDESDHFIETRGLVCHIFELSEIKKNATSKKQENIIW